MIFCTCSLSTYVPYLDLDLNVNSRNLMETQTYEVEKKVKHFC